MLASCDLNINAPDGNKESGKAKNASHDVDAVPLRLTNGEGVVQA
jgi:hypothetical protein